MSANPNEPAALITCRQCGNAVPRMVYCIRCGNPLSDEYTVEARQRLQRRFAAAPDEPVNTVAMVSTMFPQLPHAHMRTFRLALAAGAAIVVGLAAIGAFPVALVAAAVVVPLLMVLYVYVIDIFEDEPLSVVGATMGWGAVTGALFAIVIAALPSSIGFGGQGTGTILFNGVLLPLVEGALMLIGPLLLLPARRFNDVLDGATFGAASAVTFVGAYVIVSSLPVLSSGLQPRGDVLPWIVQLLSLGVLQPVIAAGAIGSAAAAVWLRYRAPVADRRALGLLGTPVIALLAAAVLLVAAGLAKATLTLIPETVTLAVVAALALLWLRLALHVGLIEEEHEFETAEMMSCPNCGHATPQSKFCGHCGVALRALPRAARSKSTPAEAPNR
jgi:uncharacterized OB-fold protein